MLAQRSPLSKAADSTRPERAVARVINQSTRLLTYSALTDEALAAAARGPQALINHLPWEQAIVKLGDVVDPIAKAVGTTVLAEAGKIEAKLAFNTVDALSRKYAQEQAGKLIVNITETQRATIRQVLGTAMGGDLTKDAAARRIRQTIGLHPAWAQAVRNFETRQLATVPKGYSPARWEATVAKRTDAYYNRLLRRRADNIARTEIITAENLGRYGTWADSIGRGLNGQDSRKEWSPGPGACKICQKHAGEIVQWDQHFNGGLMMPPAHPSCLPATSRIVVPADVSERFALTVASAGSLGDTSQATAATVAEAVGHGSWVGISAVTERDYVGDFIDIVTELGHKLTITPNHPVATPRGFVPAGLLREGDYVLSRTGRDQLTLRGPHIEDVEATIKEVADAVPVALGPVPTAAEDFHGDGTEGQVHVVRAAGPLCDHGNPMFSQTVSKSDLISADIAGRARLTGSTTDKILRSHLDSPSSFVRGGGQLSTAIRSETVHAGIHGSGTVARLDAGLQEAPSDCGSADAEGFCEGLLADAPEVTAAKIVSIKRYATHTKVYNCNTTSGWYVADGIIVHNCRCTAVLLPAPYENPALKPRTIDWLNPLGDRQLIDLDPFEGGFKLLEDVPAVFPAVPTAPELPPARVKATKADDLTYDSTLHWSDEKLMQQMARYSEDDPEAFDKILDIIDLRAAAAEERAAREARILSQIAQENQATPPKPYARDVDPDTNPTVKPERHLNARQINEEEYQQYIGSQINRALEDLNGVFVNNKQLAAFRAKGMTEADLFTGPYHVAQKYASEELKEWWLANGRETLGSFRYRVFQRPTDYVHAQRVKNLGHASGQARTTREYGL